MVLTIGSVISEHAPGSATTSAHLFIGIKGGVKVCSAGVIPTVSFRPQQVHTQPECVPKMCRRLQVCTVHMNVCCGIYAYMYKACA